MRYNLGRPFSQAGALMNDAFISYSRQDAAWAERLEADLRFRHFDVFRDTSRINAGDDWEEALFDNLEQSRNLILLWTDQHAKSSNWVNQEAAGFRMLMRLEQRKGIAGNRRILQVCLDGRNTAYSRFNMIEDLGDGKQFAAGPAAVDANKWGTVLDQLEAAMRFDDRSPVIAHVILASTAERMGQIPKGSNPMDAEPFGALLGHLGLTQDDLVKHYGEERWEWRPFGSDRNILTILAQLRSELINAGGPSFRWKPQGDELWEGKVNEPSFAKIKKELATPTRPSVVVVDALSLYDPLVLGRFIGLTGCLYNKLSCVMVLAPFTVVQQRVLRDAIGQLAQEMYERFYGLEFDATRILLANCGPLVSDEQDVRRLLAATLRQSRQDNPQWWQSVAEPPA